MGYWTGARIDVIVIDSCKFNWTEKRFSSYNKLKVIFDKLQMAVTPGQAIVFYYNEFVIGGGIIEEPINN